MNRTSPGFFAVSAAIMGAFLAVTMGAAFMFAPALHAEAYSVGGGSVTPTTPPSAGAIGQGYDFTSSFQNLISAFTSFANNIQATNGTVTLGGPKSGAPSGVTVTVDTQPYIMQFDNWFYSTTGVHVAGLLDLVVHFISWAIGVANMIITWFVTQLTRSLGGK